jgi:hypothetical protein
MELVPRDATLPPLPADASSMAPARDPKWIEMLLGRSNVTNYLDADFEYLVTALYDPPDTLHDGAPIDESQRQCTQHCFLLLASTGAIPL